MGYGSPACVTDRGVPGARPPGPASRLSPLASRREFLEGPGVAVRVAEIDEPPPRLLVDLAGLDAAVDQVLAGGRSVGNHNLDPLLRPGRHLGDPGAQHNRAGRAGRGELHEPQSLVVLVVVVGVEAD